MKQVILFVWMNVFNCNNDVNTTACVCYQYVLIVLVLVIGFMFSIVIMMLIQKPVLLSVRFDSISTGHWFFIFVFLLN